MTPRLSRQEQIDAETIERVAEHRWTSMAACFPERPSRQNIRLAERLAQAGLLEIDPSFRVRLK